MPVTSSHCIGSVKGHKQKHNRARQKVPIKTFANFSRTICDIIFYTLVTHSIFRVLGKFQLHYLQNWQN